MLSGCEEGFRIARGSDLSQSQQVRSRLAIATLENQNPTEIEPRCCLSRIGKERSLVCGDCVTHAVLTFETDPERVGPLTQIGIEPERDSCTPFTEAKIAAQQGDHGKVRVSFRKVGLILERHAEA